MMIMKRYVGFCLMTLAAVAVVCLVVRQPFAQDHHQHSLPLPAEESNDPVPLPKLRSMQVTTQNHSSSILAEAGEGGQQQDQYWVSITGIRIKNAWVYPRFAWQSAQIALQIMWAPGNLQTNYYFRPMHHTFTVWTDRESMLAFMSSGAHLGAIQMAEEVGSWAAFAGTYFDHVPTWEEAREYWEENKRVAFGENGFVAH